MASFRRIAAVTMVSLCAQSAAAAPSSPLPAPIAKVLAEMAAQCKDATGQNGNVGQALSRADLNGDGVQDYIFQDGGYDCPGAASLFGGTAATGNPLSVYIADRAGGARRVWSDGVGDWSVKPRAGKPTLFVMVICETNQNKPVADWKWCDKRLLPNPGPGAWVAVPK
jgi:hypothetical protein